MSRISNERLNWLLDVASRFVETRSPSGKIELVRAIPIGEEFISALEELRELRKDSENK